MLDLLVRHEPRTLMYGTRYVRPRAFFEIVQFSDDSLVIEVVVEIRRRWVSLQWLDAPGVFLMVTFGPSSLSSFNMSDIK